MKKIFKTLFLTCLFAFVFSNNINAEENELEEMKDVQQIVQVEEEEPEESSFVSEQKAVEVENVEIITTKSEVKAENEGTPIISVHVYDTITGTAVEQSSSPLQNSSNSSSWSKQYHVYQLLDSLTVSNTAQEVVVDGITYRFAGWYDAAKGGNKISESGTTFGEVTLYQLPASNTRKNGLKISAPKITAEAEISVYAHWEYAAEPHTIKVNFYDVKPGKEATKVKEYSQVITPGTGWAKLFTIDQIFGESNDRPYSGVENANDNTETGNGNLYTFVGWYDAASNGTKITTGYTLSGVYAQALQELPIAPGYAIDGKVTGATPYEISFRVKNVLDNDYEINFYAYWEEQGPQTVTVNFYDVKPGKDPVKVQEYSETLSPGTDWAKIATLSQIFTKGSDRGYSGVDNDSDNTETDANHIYTFLGWYDAASNGTQITTGYTLSGIFAQAFQELPLEAGYAIDGKIAGATPYELSFRTNSILTDDYEINFYGYWSVEEAAYLKIKHVNKVTQEGNTSWENENSTVSSYTKNYSNPSNTSTHQFLYWKVYNEDETEYDGKEYNNDNPKFTFYFEGLTPGSTTVLIGKAIWKANITLSLYDGTTLLGSDSKFDSISVSDILTENPKKTGYTFLGWLDENGNKVNETTFAANKPSDNPETKLVKLYADWKKATIEIEVTKEWDDNNDEDEIRPDSVSAYLYANDVKIKEFEITKANGWKTVISDLDEFDDSGEKITYTIEEQEVEFYDSSVDGFVIKNYHEPWPKGEGEDPDEPEEPTQEPENPNIPKTGDNILTYVVLLLTSVFGLSATLYLKKFASIK